MEDTAIQVSETGTMELHRRRLTPPSVLLSRAAVTVALWLFRGFPGRKVGWYIISQVLGATLASLVVYSNYRYSIGLYEGQGLPSAIRTVTGPHATAPLFFTFPQPWLPASSAFLSEMIASAALICVVFALGDKSNLPTPKGTMAFAMFIVLIGIGAAMGVNTGYALNGARDSGPRIALWLLGYGNEIWTHNSAYWAWAPWLAAITGGCVGGFVRTFSLCSLTVLYLANAFSSAAICRSTTSSSIRAKILGSIGRSAARATRS